MGKKKQPEERRPDLSIPDQEVLEEKVAAMLEIDAKPPKTPKVEDKDPKTEVKAPEDPKQSEQPEETPASTDEPVEEIITSAPELPSDEKSPESEEDPEDPEELEKLEDGDDDEVDVEEIEDPEDPEEKILDLDSAPKEAAIVGEIEDEKANPKEEPDVEPEKEVELDEPLLEDEGAPEPGTSDKTKKTEPVKSKLDSVIEDTKTGRAVEDIIAKDADEILEIEDEKVKKQSTKDTKKPLGKKITGFFKAWWNNPKARWSTIIILLTLIIAVLAIPTSRYYLLNTVGVRAKASIVIVDESTGQPLKNVQVAIGEVSTKTDTQGNANLEEVKLGAQILLVQKRAFAESKQQTTITFGNNKLQKQSLKPTGVQYSFVVRDYLSDKPVENVEAISGEASALSDSNGKIKLTVDDTQNLDKFDVSFVKEFFREDKISIDTTNKIEQTVYVVPARKHVFVSNRTGKYDVYSVDIDGANEKQLLAGTGNERDDVYLAIHPGSSVASFVSTRTGDTNEDGFKLSTLTIIDAQSGSNTEVTSSERIQVIGWIGDNLVFVQATSGASADKPDRHKLFSYNYKSQKSTEIAKSNYFNDVVIANDMIYFAPSGALQPEEAKLYMAKAEGGEKTEVAPQEVYKIFRADYDNLILSANQSWLNLRIGEQKATSTSAQPTNPKSRTYIDSKDNKNSLWVDNRDGKGVLISYEPESRNELTLKSENGLSYPVYWLSNRTIIYRVTNQQQTADYIISLDGGEPKKITDVTNADAVDGWYYY